jgi:hypothetical protein
VDRKHLPAAVVTIGFSSHRVEALPFARQEMWKHKTIMLEEPHHPRFWAMLKGELCVSDYLLEVDSEFPVFEHMMCELLKELHSRGRRILQVEPFLSKLVEIHGLFAEGARPEEISARNDLKQVYAVEKAATGALIDYYKYSMDAPFDEVVNALKTFARADAERLNLRAYMRAGAIASAASYPREDVYVESGYIHYPLYLYLRRFFLREGKVHPVFLLQPLIDRFGGRRRNMGPGDLLTLHYGLHSGLEEKKTDLLAARSLIYIKLIRKNEMLPDAMSQAPHCEDEVAVNRIVDALGYEDCEILFMKIRFKETAAAREIVEGYLAEKY